jgi:hypothetical protein
VIGFRAAAGLVPAACLFALTLFALMTGCVTRGALIAPSLTTGESAARELTDTPFYPQRTHQCGPAALATVLGASGVQVTPDALEPLVYLPKKRGSLQIEMQAAPRKFARLTYGLQPELDAILGEVEAGRPVLVLHNYGVPFFPRWHYAVVVGYDSQRDSVILRSGTTRRQVLSARNFMRAWDNGERWALVVLQPGELPAAPNKARYLEAAAAFERSAKPQDSRLAFDAAVKHWPRDPVAWVGRGTASYRSGDLNAAASDYARALSLDDSQAGARNNLAMTLLELGCAEEAREQLVKIDIQQLAGPLRDAVQDTRAQVAARAPALNEASCRWRPAL